MATKNEPQKLAINPPDELTLRFCPVCGRDTRVMALKTKHFAGGKLCSGTPRTLIYRLVKAEAQLRK